MYSYKNDAQMLSLPSRFELVFFTGTLRVFGPPPLGWWCGDNVYRINYSWKTTTECPASSVIPLICLHCPGDNNYLIGTSNIPGLLYMGTLSTDKLLNYLKCVVLVLKIYSMYGCATSEDKLMGSGPSVFTTNTRPSP